MKHFDAIIIGTGQAGPSPGSTVCGRRKTVTIIERHKFRERWKAASRLWVSELTVPTFYVESIDVQCVVTASNFTGPSRPDSRKGKLLPKSVPTSGCMK
jgi:hypothetical protein